jgi:hypothetical protein
MAGFEVIIYGRFRVITEGLAVSRFAPPPEPGITLPGRGRRRLENQQKIVAALPECLIHRFTFRGGKWSLPG